MPHPHNNRDCIEGLANVAYTEWHFYFKLKTKTEILQSPEASSLVFPQREIERANRILNTCKSQTIRPSLFGGPSSPSFRATFAVAASPSVDKSSSSNNNAIDDAKEIEERLKREREKDCEMKEEIDRMLEEEIEMERQRVLVRGMTRLQAVYRGQRCRAIYRTKCTFQLSGSTLP